MPIIEFTTDETQIPASVPREKVMFWENFQQGTNVWAWNTHEGLCLSDREMNGYDDSDFYMLVWNPEKQCAEEIMFASTRGGSYPAYGSKPDATPEVRIAYMEWRDEQTRIAKNAAEVSRVAEPDVNDLKFGTRVRLWKSSRKGCKTPYAAGEVGEVFGQYWYGTFYANGYKTQNRFNGRLGLRMNDGRKIFCPMTAVRLDRDPVVIPAGQGSLQASMAKLSDQSIDCICAA